MTGPDAELAVTDWLLGQQQGAAREQPDERRVAGFDVLAAAELRRTVVARFEVARLPPAPAPLLLGSADQPERPPSLHQLQALGRAWLCRRRLSRYHPGAAALLADCRSNLAKGRPVGAARTFAEVGASDSRVPWFEMPDLAGAELLHRRH